MSTSKKPPSTSSSSSTSARTTGLSQQFLNAADKMSDTSIAMILGVAIAYALLRFIEGYGLWRQRVWAEWLAIVSGCLYIPFEV